MNNQELELDINSTKIYPEGIQDFYWPVTYEEKINFGKTLEKKISRRQIKF